LFFLITCSKEDEEPLCIIEHVIDAYDYPVKPGSPEWAELTSNDEIDAVLQIPENILYEMSTEGLIETVLNYPRFADIYASENYQISFDVLTENFNGFHELLQRSDAAVHLLER